MKTKQRKLIPAIAMLVVAAVTLTSASYAWFTMSREVEATGIQLTATAPSNLLIASGAKTDGGDNQWYNTKAHTKYNASTNVNLKLGENAGQLMPVSSADGLKLYYPDATNATNGTVDLTKAKFYEATAANAIQPVKDGETLTAAMNGYYVDIPLWLKNEGADAVKVVLKTVDTVTTGKVTSILPANDSIEADKNLSKAARFAILSREKTDDSVTAFTGNYMYKPTGAAYLTGANGPIGSIDGTSHLGTETDDKTDPTTIKWISTTANPTAEMFVLGGDAEQLITIRVWLEGQDASCITDWKDGKIQINLVFADLDYITTVTP